MKTNKLTIFIAKTPTELFNFALNPSNTVPWVDSIVKEVTNEWSEYMLHAFEQDKMFEMVAKDGNYHARYTFTSTQKGTHLEYAEWVERGKLTEPFTKEQLEN